MKLFCFFTVYPIRVLSNEKDHRCEHIFIYHGCTSVWGSKSLFNTK